MTVPFTGAYHIPSMRSTLGQSIDQAKKARSSRRAIQKQDWEYVIPHVYRSISGELIPIKTTITASSRAKAVAELRASFKDSATPLVSVDGKPEPKPKQADVTVENCGSISLFTPNSNAARAVFAQKLGEAQTYGISVACEHRYAGKLAESLTGCGLVLR